MKKINKEELEKLTSLRTEYATLRNRLCDITLTEERLKTDKQQTLMNISEATQMMTEFHKTLQDKYGDGQINMQTGEIS
jgi:hypothetical protein